MNSKTLKVIAKINAIPGKESILQEVLIKLIEPTRNEPGCISYILLNNISDQGEFTFFEEWMTGKDLETHIQSAHFKDAVKNLDVLIDAEPDIKQYHSIEIG